jgi:YbgC/YbaW family acyl-CoA thioester hydrolase
VISEYRLKRRVQFYETDTAGLVHFSWYYRYMEEAEHALWREAGLSIAPPGAEIGFPRVAASFDFRRPLRFEDEFEVHLTIADITATTIRYTANVTRDEMGIATGTLTVACVRKIASEPMRSMEIPADIANRFEVASDARGRHDDR